MLSNEIKMIDKFFSNTLTPLLSLFVIILLSPFFIILSILVLILDGRPILFKSERAGFLGKPFILYKFRTMKNNDLIDEKRITKLGKFLRRSSLDELPQLFNILIGDMVFVGPRPLPFKTLLVEKYYKYFNKRSSVKPGLTGLSQVFSMGKPRDYSDKILYDLVYIKKKSILFDIIIIFMTFKVLKRRFKNNKSGQSL